MWKVLTVFGLGLAAIAFAPVGTHAQKSGPPAKGKSETIQLFDGKTLDGWEGYKEYWSVKDGVIVAKNTEPVTISTYLLTKQQFSDFHLKLSAKLVQSEMHSGVAFWGKVGPDAIPENRRKEKCQYTYAGHLVMFPNPWGMFDLFGRMGNLKVDSKAGRAAGKERDWNDIEVLAVGDRVQVAINGKRVVDWTDPEPKRIHTAPIALQLHDNKVAQEVHFKGITVTTFPSITELKSND